LALARLPARRSPLVAARPAAVWSKLPAAELALGKALGAVMQRARGRAAGRCLQWWRRRHTRSRVLILHCKIFLTSMLQCTM
jgi:hypothetical protein